MIADIFLFLAFAFIIYNNLQKIKIKKLESSSKEALCKKYDITPLEYELLSVISNHKDVSIESLSKALKHTIYIDPLIVSVDNAIEKNMELDEYIKSVQLDTLDRIISLSTDKIWH